MPFKRILLTLILACPLSVNLVPGQRTTYPREIRGYKIERAVVEVKKDKKASHEPEENDLLRFGNPRLVRATPLGITLEVPIVVSPVKQKGHVDFLVFENMTVNGTGIEVDEYHREFDLPNKDPLTLREPLSFYIYLPQAVLAAVDEWSDSKEIWPVTGRIYVFGHFNKSLFKFKRCIPIELNVTVRNPLHK